MGRVVRDWGIVLVLLAGVLSAAAPASAGAASGAVPLSHPEGGTLDGFAIHHVPSPAAGADVFDTDYEWGGVSFAARFWEREADGGHRVEMQVLVMRGGSLDSAAALRSFLAEYHERDAATWAPAEFDHDGAPGFLGEREAFWLQEPGVAVEVRDSSGVLGREELVATALGVRPEE
ncbi:hypothetical protein J0910_18280 [Nocardiopsis sp. CNT-189]|uniref:hypothetical protein n=1 Tax=Nocardiopsis oceanisediminis TaxID=2816862 RepID=UPI003B300ECF